MEGEVRLPATVVPRNYAIRLRPDFSTFTFDGTASITIEVREECDRIVLHAKDLIIHHVLFKRSKPSLFASQISLNESLETATFVFDQKLSRGSAILEISFQGNLNDDMCGFYRTLCYNQKGEPRWAASTQFEPTDARRAFPCWDEPNKKATFDLTLEYLANKNLTAVSNMPVSSSRIEGEYEVVTFAQSPIMPTYLVAFVVGEFDYIEDTTSEGVAMRCYTPAGKPEQGKFALSVAVKALDHFSKRFGIPYPLPKLDMIAIPDFSNGAMENWGLMIFREAALLIDPLESAASRRQRVARTVCHEIAHQWFGNIVTMDWWTWLWLNEGFARYAEHLPLEEQFPAWDIWVAFVQNVVGGALALDSLKSSHAIEIDVNHPSEIESIFDTISYAKGASIIRMLISYMSEDIFFKGLNLYLTRHKYSNATSEDLWAALSEASEKPIKDIMLQWTREVGYPVVTVTLEQKDENTTTCILKQSRFLLEGADAKDVENTMWQVPLFVTTERKKGESPQMLHLLHSTDDQIEITGVKKGEWIKFNAGQTGMYRVHYPSEMLQLLGKAVSSQSLPPSDRLGLADDTFALTKSGHIKAVDYLSFIRDFYKDNETHFSVWAKISANLENLGLILSQEQDIYPLFKRYVADLFHKIGEKLGWDVTETEEDITSMFRGMVLTKLASCDDERTVKEAKKRFELFLKDKKSLSTELRAPVYKMMVAHYPDEYYTKVQELYRASDFSEEKRRCLIALGCAKSAELLQKTLEFTLSSEVRANDVIHGITSIATNPIGRHLVWNHLKANWEEYNKRFGGGAFMLGSVIGATISRFTKEETAKDIEAFFEANPSPLGERVISQSLEKIRNYAKLLHREKENIKAWLGAQGY